MKCKLCFLAPSSYGKTTAVNILKKYYNVDNIKIAQPLYDLQDIFYKKINKDIDNKQDGELLQFFGQKIRKENENYLKDEFLKKIKISNLDIIVNDDCRPPDYDFLKNEGFLFIKIDGYSRNREDHTKANSDLNIEWQNISNYDYIIENKGDIYNYEKNIIKVMEEIFNDK